MDPIQIRKILGLPEKATDAEVQTKLAAHFTAAADAQKNAALSQALLAQLPAVGLKVEGDKIVKLAAAPAHEPKPEDDAEKKELRKLLAATSLAQGKDKIAKATELAQSYVKGYKVPPAVEGDLAELFKISEEASVLALSQDGAELLKKPFDAVKALRKILDAVPAMSKESLAQLGVKTSDDKPSSDDLRAKGREAMRKAQGRKEPAKT